MTENTRVDALSQRREIVPSDASAVVYRVRQAIYLLSVVIPGMIAMRLVLSVLGADPASGFGGFVYSVTAPLVAPFVGIFGPSQPRGGPEPQAAVAMAAYLLVAWLLAGAVWVLWEKRDTTVTASMPAVAPPPAEALPASIV